MPISWSSMVLLATKLETGLGSDGFLASQTMSNGVRERHCSLKHCHALPTEVLEV